MSKRVTRIDPAAATDLSGRWNDTDSRLVANALITQALTAPWAKRHADAHGGDAPAIIVGEVRNRTLEHLATQVFVRDLERAFLGSGTVRLVASKEEREGVRDERRDQQQHAAAGTRSRLANELGARYMLIGEVQAIEDQEGREKTVLYQVDATLVDLESNAKVWAGQHKIKKYIERARFSL